MNFNAEWNKRPIILLGAGQLGQMALNLWPTFLKRPIMFLDEFRAGSIDGINIEKTKDHKFSSEYIYILSFFKDKASNVTKLFDNVINQKIITVYDLLTTFIPDEFSNGWIGDEKKYNLALSNIQLFNDEHSKNVYKSVVEWRYKRILDQNYPVSLETNKYNLAKYNIKNLLFDLVIDGGAYDFSFLNYLDNAEITWNKLIAFEPDSNRLEILNKLLKEFKISGKKNIPILDHRAIWTDNNGCNFYSNGQLSARIASEPNKKSINIKTISLNEILNLNTNKLNDKILVKLHVEGSEWPVISSFLPYMSNFNDLNFLINLSHDENSLLNIPRALSETNKFELYLDSHSLFGEGLTLFVKNKFF